MIYQLLGYADALDEQGFADEAQSLTRIAQKLVQSKIFPALNGIGKYPVVRGRLYYLDSSGKLCDKNGTVVADRVMPDGKLYLSDAEVGYMNEEGVRLFRPKENPQIIDGYPMQKEPKLEDSL
jgi:hypothetical protein